MTDTRFQAAAEPRTLDGRRIVDLSMRVHPDMLTFPRVPPPSLCVCETHEQFAERIGAAAFGVERLTAHYIVVQDDHVGTHMDALKHIVPDAGGPETIPLEYCMGDGVLLDFTWAEKGHGITAAEACIHVWISGSRRRPSTATWSSSCRPGARSSLTWRAMLPSWTARATWTSTRASTSRQRAQSTAESSVGPPHDGQRSGPAAMGWSGTLDSFTADG